jgi:hypothetical protein
MHYRLCYTFINLGIRNAKKASKKANNITTIGLLKNTSMKFVVAQAGLEPAT